MKWPRSSKRVALVLGGGAARGLAHIGVLQVFDAQGIKFDVIVGSSVGALIGAAHAVGMFDERTEIMAQHLRWKDLVDLTVPRLGLNGGGGLARVIDEAIGDRGFEDASCELAVVTTDIETGEEVVFTSGPLKTVIRASCSIPGIFVPVEVGGRLLVDGGIKDVVPVRVARQLAVDAVVAVDVGLALRRPPLRSIVHIIIQAYQIKGRELNQYQSLDADVVIEPVLSDEVDQAAFHLSSETINAGRAAATAALPDLERLFKRWPWSPGT